MGQRASPTKRFYIVDADGPVEVEESFIKSNPAWYVYSGYTTLNGDYCYCYRLRT